MTRSRKSVLLTAFLIAAMGAGGKAADAVFSPNPLTAVYEGQDYSTRNDPSCSVTLACPRNGEVSGQVVVFSKTPQEGAVVTGCELSRAGGGGAIPAAAVKVRYALKTGVNGVGKYAAGVQGAFDALSDVPAAGLLQCHPVWITVKVPADAPAGEYEGRLSVAGRTVPVRLTVAAWVLPDAGDFRTFVDFIESPESVALRYEVPLWSDRHFELIGSCFAQLARVGNKTLLVPLAAKSNLGNEQTMIRWIKTPEEKVFKHDFGPFERYLDAAITNRMKPQIVVAHVYEDFFGGSQGKGGEGGVLVSLLDPATGTTSLMEGPGHNNGVTGWTNYPACHYAFWKPVFDGMLERMKARGIPAEALGLGLSRDMMPGKPTLDNLKLAAPSAGWVSHSHGERFGLHGMRGAYCTTVWNARFPKDPATSPRTYGWKNDRIVLHNDRDIWKPSLQSQLVRSRTLGELNICGAQRGFGRMSADFWPCLKDEKGNLTRAIPSRFPKSDWVQLNLRQTPYLYPGSNGALATIRFEMLREGLQECEARIYIEKALQDPAAKAKLGEALCAEAQALLDDRVRALLSQFKAGKIDALTESDAGFAGSNWQDDSRRLFAAAARVAAAVAK